MPQGQPVQEPTHPYPPRFWWLKRIALGWLTIIVLLLVIRLIWGWEINRRINNQLAQWRAQGQPTRPEDFAEPDVPDEQNAALVLKGIELHPPSPMWPPPALTAEVVAEYKKLLLTDAGALQTVRKARAIEKVRWGDAFYRPNYLRRPVNHLDWTLIDLLEVAAIDAHERNRPADVLGYLDDLLFLHDAYGRSPWPEDVNGHAFCAVAAVALKIARGFEAGAIRTERVRVQTLVGALMDERSLAVPIIRALHAERIRLLHEYRQDAVFMRLPDWLHRTPVDTACRWLMQPAVDAVALADMQSITEIADQIARPDLDCLDRPGARSQIVPLSAFAVCEQIAELKQCYGIGETPIRRASYWPISCLARRTDAVAAAMCLAIRLYQADHDGQLPRQLTDLVPGYLPTVPADPFSKTGNPFGYEPAANPPFLQSEGPNDAYPLASQAKAVDQSNDEAHENVQPDDPSGQKKQP